MIPGPARGHVGNYGRANTPQTLGHCDNRPEEAGSTEGDEADDADEGRDVFDSQGRRFYGPALKANNVMRLLKHTWFRAECDHTLRTRLALHCRESLISWRSISCQAPVFPSSRLSVFLAHRMRRCFCLIKPTACACVSV